MKAAPSGRSVALELAERVLHGAWLTPTLSTLLDAASLAHSERARATDLSYGTFRRLPQLDFILAPLLRAPQKLPPRVRNALRLGAYELLHGVAPSYATVDAWVDLVKQQHPKLSGLTNAVLRRVRELPASAPADVALALEPWLLAEFEAALGTERAASAAAAMLAPGPLWLTEFSPTAQAALEADGAVVARHDELAVGPLTPLSVKAPTGVSQLRAYGEGLVLPQNPSSLQAVGLLAPVAGERVYDLASGRGVKTAALAALGATVTSFELDPSRQAAAQETLTRLGLQADLRVADLLMPVGVPPAGKVLLDAPCSGTGTLRGNPEIKLRLSAETVRQLAEQQFRMLELAAELVTPGGTLVYSVCSLTEAEGVGVVRQFLAGRPEFEAAPPSLESPHPAGAWRAPAGGLGEYLLPLDGLDGFFVSRLQKRRA